MASSILLSHPLSSPLHLPKPKFLPPNSSKSSCFCLKSITPRNPLRAHLLANGRRRFKNLVLTRVMKTEVEGDEAPPMVGEDSAEFVLSKQKITSWVYFTGILGVVLYILNVAWIDNSTGFGKVFVDSLSSISDSPEVRISVNSCVKLIISLLPLMCSLLVIRI